MNKSLIKLVENNFKNVKKNKINLEIDSLNEVFEDEIIDKNELKNEIKKVKDMFNECNTAEELIRAISIRDFEDASCTERYLLNNIRNLI